MPNFKLRVLRYRIALNSICGIHACLPAHAFVNWHYALKKLIIANWKAAPTTAAEAEELFNYTSDICGNFCDKVELVICPPFVYLEPLSKIKSAIRLGAQDIFWQNSGPYTGEVTPDMLKSLGVEYVLIGHSERRLVLGETDEIINKKVKAALGADIKPVLLIGERKKTADRDKIIEKQTAAAVEGLGSEQVSNMVFAYEPVWAVSTNPDARADTPDNAIDALGVIKNFVYSKFRLKPDGYRFIYGGSVNQDNAANYFIHQEISGAAVGSASLRKDEFANIVKMAGEIKNENHGD